MSAWQTMVDAGMISLPRLVLARYFVKVAFACTLNHSLFDYLGNMDGYCMRVLKSEIARSEFPNFLLKKVLKAQSRSGEEVFHHQHGLIHQSGVC